MSEVVTLRDCREAGYCLSGILEWLRRRGIEKRRLMDGIPVEEAEKIDDAMVARVVRYVRAGRRREAL